MSRKFRLEFDAGNSAFDDYPWTEAARILRMVASELEREQDQGTISDANGNRIGEWFAEGFEDDEDDGPAGYVLCNGHDPDEAADGQILDRSDAVRLLEEWSEDSLVSEADELDRPAEYLRDFRRQNGNDPYYIARPVDKDGNFVGARKEWIAGPI